jgi:hypothetical protein
VLERVVLHCLEKNPAQRFQSTRDVTFALESLSGLSSNRTLAEALTAPGPRRNTRAWLPSAIAGALLLALIVMLPDSAGDSYPLWSPDAKRIVFASYRTGSWGLYEKSASGGESEKVILASVEEKVPR